MSLVDPRVKKQAEVLVNYSCKVKPGENVAIFADFMARPLVLEIYKKLITLGAGEVKLHFSDYEFAEVFYKNASEKQVKSFPQVSMDEMKKMDCFVGISSSANTRGLTGVDAEKMASRAKVTRPISDWRVEKTKWVITRFPTNAQAQEADMSLSNYENFVFGAVNKVDWKKKFAEQEKIRKLIDKASQVRILAKDTDLTLSIAGRMAENCAGEHNMPDGEVFTSVVENSANGYISYSFPALYMGREYHNIRLEFKNGKVVSARAEKGEVDLNKILDMDKGARFIGELGFGNNYAIKQFTKDILFDEKIGGTVHIALGKGYKETGSKNASALHWDMICDLRKNGEVLFDGKVVQKNGKWLF
ncbi:aminopeptidase [Patescibacteria group bacterium]|nr:aminopeptidase [Patescibacteria group bacterium]